MGGGGELRSGYDECPCDSLPDVLLSRIFSLLPARFIVTSCAFVCRAWREASHDPALWAHFCRGTGLRAADELRQTGGWRSLFVAVYGPSLVATPWFQPIEQIEVDRCKGKHAGPWEPKHRFMLDRICSLDDASEEHHYYSHWAVEGGSQFHRGGGDGVVREKPPVECPPCPAGPDEYVIATSCEWGRLQQYIGLQSFSNKFLDESPPLAFTVWYAGRRGTPGSFRIYLVLRDELKNCIIIWDSGVMSSKEEEWKQAKFLIKGYPKGLRTMMVKVAGKSTTEIRGFHGTKFTGVRLHFVPGSELENYADYDKGVLVPPTS